MPWLLAALAALIGFVGFRRVRVDRSKPAYPPGPDAIDAERAMALGAALAAKPRLDRSDLAIQFAPSVSATVEPLLHGRQFFPRMLADIGAATSSVHLMIYGFKPGDIGTTFRDLLVTKAAAGVQVRLVVDAIGSEVAFGSKQLYRELTDGGVEVVANEGMGPDLEGRLGSKRRLDWRFDDLGHFDHRKFMIVDGRIGYVGGAGIEDHFNDERFYDVFVRYTGPAVHQLQTLFIAAFRYHQGPLPTDAAVDRRLVSADRDAGRRRGPDHPPDEHPGRGPLPDHRRDRGRCSRGRPGEIDIVNPYITDHGDPRADAGRRRPRREGPDDHPGQAHAALRGRGLQELVRPDARRRDRPRGPPRHGPRQGHPGRRPGPGRWLQPRRAQPVPQPRGRRALRGRRRRRPGSRTHLFDAWQAVSSPVQVATKPTERAFNAVMDLLSPLM